MTERAAVVAVGASVATAALVSQLRESGHQGRIVVIDRDPDMPYDRPPLSKEFLATDGERPEAPWWTDSCELVHGRVEGFETTTHTLSVRMPGGELREIAGDHVVIATGSTPVRIPGQPEGVLELRSASDARELRVHARPGQRVVILGAGTVGTELASSLSAAGADVCLIDLAERPLDRFFAGHLGVDAASWIQDAAVDLRLGTRVAGIERSGDRWLVATDRGIVAGDAVVCAVGTRPAVGWLANSDVALDNGVLCDADGQVLDTAGNPVPGVHAIGDVANWPSYDGTRRRREDWTSAQRQGRHVALALVGQQSDDLSAERDYFWTTQFGRRIQVLGTPIRDGVLVQQVADPDRNAAFYTVERNGETVAWISINRPREFALAMRQSVVGAS
ncbi:3-phenylpropionate/trans-cinnamate dioxygenase ferredoxin reductase subunit [Nocardioides aromaticivorans]|uniref:3-phenylpropionate/trans-cinnamate dioxygenase ferredoxin reductase subunit n=1 Tax=Nocardioides aromaticivorans TaxID=200618 RepID=A0A7Z0CNA6_9ACTN|nr:FAD-dependent oxidoreductase [Nocardioides aromaticivorans]NYI44983.1 3-phenylpropionate/trans-cinnamate dioxygenase ferredoxin reductase subunit [Nocardioides aromaticivorans]